MSKKEEPKGAAPDRTDDPAGGSLFDRAKVKAPNLTKEFVAEYGMDDDFLAGIARGEISPPPTVGPIHSSDLHFEGGAWVSTPPGVKPEDAGKDAIAR